MIKSITLKNLLSFGDPGVTLELKPLNVLIGANGSGKSNLIDAISLLQAAPRDIAEPVRSGGVTAWMHGALPPPDNAQLAAVIVPPDGIDVDIQLSFASSGDTRFLMKGESIRQVER